LVYNTGKEEFIVVEQNGNGKDVQPVSEAPPAEAPRTGGNGGAAAPPARQSNALGTVGLITGILGLILAVCCYPLGIVLGLVALICGFIAKAKGQRFAVASIILGLLCLALVFVVTLVLRDIARYLPDFLEDYIYQFQSQLDF
jgi:hypothetical protein